MVQDAIEGAVAWFHRSRLEGIRLEKTPDDVAVVSDTNAPPLWARFYDIETNQPIFCGRDGIIKPQLAQIERERRTGYAWYTDRPAQLLSRDYPAWKRKLAIR
ncbi:MAG: hypothetical protein OHK0029_01130 [Armatimonadaceae bacterium]